MTSTFDEHSRTAWISKGFESLIEQVRHSPADRHFDVLIVGSGYGGAISAATFAGCRENGLPIKVGVLERGNEYLSGAFPTGISELPRHIRRDRNKEGLFDVRPGPEVVTIVANGLGGGSLINAGVMEKPLPAVFRKGWPHQLADLSRWDDHFDRAAELLGARIRQGGSGEPRDNTIENHEDGLPQKHRSVRSLAPDKSFRPAAITVAMADSLSSAHVELKKCALCGDCASGCNLGAKNSLDLNLLVRAHLNGAEIFSGATVLDIAPDDDGWIVSVVHTNAALRARDSHPLKVRTGKLVLAAGMLGSNEILLRSRLDLPKRQLGEHCSTNGDMLVTDFATAAPVNAVADETVKPSEREIGPTISGIIDLRETAGLLIEEMAVPASLRLAFAEVFSTASSLHALDDIDWSFHRHDFPLDDVYAVPPGHIGNSAIYAVMGDDGAAGKIEMMDVPATDRDGIARIRWKDLSSHPLFDRQVDVVARLTEKTGGRVIGNPFWKLLPDDMLWLVEGRRGPLATVHPLGGCAMADDGSQGVVDHLGRVFRSGSSSAVHDGLVVLDGSVVPTALGTNPALTISAIALRASEALAREWGYEQSAPPSAGPPLARPRFRETDAAAAPSRTEIEIVERLVGPVSLLTGSGETAPYMVELTLRFRPKEIAGLLPFLGGDATLEVAADRSELLAHSEIRIFSRPAWEDLERSWAPAGSKEQMLDARAVFRAPLTGTLKVLERGESSFAGRVWRSGKAWLLNRGLRDIYQAIIDGEGDGPGPLKRARAALAVASRAGALRHLRYDLRIGTPIAGATIELTGDRIAGTKTFSYDRCCNPWRQLMEVTLQHFPGMTPASERVLRLDLGYLARIGLPLFRITGQRDGVSAIGDLAAFFGYFLRLLIGHHIWSFRAPDKEDGTKPVFRPPDKLELPGGGFAYAEIIFRPIVGGRRPDLRDETDPAPVRGRDAPPNMVRITRYPQKDGTSKRPVVMLHGYSAGGTTFAHHAVNPNLASHLWNAGRDVWIADLRTSPANTTTASLPWSFDQIGREDVRCVIEAAAATSESGQVDVVAHCMGAVVFSIAVLDGKVANMVNRACLTQVGPLVVFTPANVFREYVIRYLLEFLPDRYEFRPATPTLADDLLDRFLSALPYPVEEFSIENPLLPWKRTPWTRTRHRMDALYGRAFNVANMEPKVLRFIDEHFGALSLKTVATTLHFVRYALMTNHKGLNELVSRENFATFWKFPTRSIHGEENGMFHLSTVDRMGKILKDAGRTWIDPFINPGAGHQDALIGTKRHATFSKIEEFLDADLSRQEKEPDTEFSAYPPWMGPILTEEWSANWTKLSPSSEPPSLILRLGSLPSHRRPEGAVLLRVNVLGDDIQRPDGQQWTEQYVADHMVYYWSRKLRKDRWDVFEAPLPDEMPGDPAHRGNALLVLLVYAEDRELVSLARDHFFAQMREDKVFDLPRRAAPAGGFKDAQTTTDSDHFKRLANAAFEAIRLSEGGPRRTQGPGPKALEYLGTRPVERLLIDPETRKIVEGETEVPSFGRALEDRNAVLERMLEADRNLMDGVVPYDPPLQSPAEPDACGTCFSLSSCQYPAGFFDAAVAYRSFARLAARFGTGVGIEPRFMLFVGDQVYVDPTAGLYDPVNSDARYRLPYENWLRQRSVRDALRRVPSFMLLDDHEIDDNWEPVSSPDESENREKREAGVAQFRKYQRGLEPGLETFHFDGFHFFMLDTRTGRDHRKVGTPDAKMFDQPTMERLKKWLRDAPGPKFVLSPHMLLPRHRRAVQRDLRLDPRNLSSLHSDGWDGYPGTLRDVLGFMAKESIDKVVFLSGDEHRGCIAKVKLRDENRDLLATVHSIHTAAMYAPYPFANSIDEDIVAEEEFDFTFEGKAYHCSVEATRPPAGDGATFFFVRQDGASWKLDCQFGDGAVQTLIL